MLYYILLDSTGPDRSAFPPAQFSLSRPLDVDFPSHTTRNISVFSWLPALSLLGLAVCIPQETVQLEPEKRFVQCLVCSLSLLIFVEEIACKDPHASDFSSLFPLPTSISIKKFKIIVSK